MTWRLRRCVPIWTRTQILKLSHQMVGCELETKATFFQVVLCFWMCFGTSGTWMSHQSGYIDDHNYLCLSGRYKEIINRGGEKISPFEAARSERRGLREYFEFVSRAQLLGMALRPCLGHVLLHFNYYFNSIMVDVWCLTFW